MASDRHRRNPYYDGPQSDHFDGTHFHNPGGVPPGGLRDLLRWQLLEKRAPWPQRLPDLPPPAKPVDRLGTEALRVTMVGHATMLVQAGGFAMLTDPVWSDRASPLRFAGPKRVSAPGIAFDDLPAIDVVLLSHNHYDHMDLETLARLHARHRPLVVTPLGNDTILRRRVPDARIAVTDWGGQTEIAGGIRIHTEPCHHWSARGSRDRRMALWAAFVVETPAGKIYHVGDTGFHYGINYRAAREKHGGFRLALLPFGAYEPRWFMKGQHQNPEEAVAGMRLCGAAHVAGHHWGTFRLTNEGIGAPVTALHAALDAAAIPRGRFRPLKPGEVFDVPPAD
ncbi:MBL fold metallo-hydrolase [Rhizobium sp. TRM95111]|uniref:MBL fold metallo-hydrolase n=1 Tax=Rhizobium alarense TaxID=2846851 RepID=UPI001F3407C9|nr:MBL fold metallo-hydrolase [Rhizobium alarense]MCF3641308.1 MBL fold metallo-hydrolase [Rhizobium alarense]